MVMGKNQFESDYQIAKQVAQMKLTGEPTTIEEFFGCFSEELLNSDDVVEYAAHPGYVDYELLQISSLTTGRCHDAFIFTSPEVLKWVEDHKVELVDYSVLQKIK